MNRRELLKGIAAAPVAAMGSTAKSRQLYIHDSDKAKARVLTEGLDAEFGVVWDSYFGAVDVGRSAFQ